MRSEAACHGRLLTTVVYRFPRTTAPVLRFYETQLGRRGWDRARHDRRSRLHASGALVP